MKHLKKFESYLITEEASGLADATLMYSDLIMKFMEFHLGKFLLSNQPKYKMSEKVDITKVNEIITNEKWPTMPVSTIEVVFSFTRKSDEQFKKDYPTTARIKKHTSTGACASLAKGKQPDSSYIDKQVDERIDHSIYLLLDLGCVISDSFSEEDDLLLEMESTTLHELNHAYEGYKRMMSGAGQLSTDVTYALDANRSKVKKEIFKTWSRQISYFVYWSEKHEMNAMIQDAWPYVKKFRLEEMKMKCPTWIFSQQMIDFDKEKFKQEMYQEITKHYPEANPEIILNRLKNGFANQLDKEREISVLAFEDSPSLKGGDIRKMSTDKFLDFVQNRVNAAGRRIQKRIIKLYSLK